MQTRQRIIKYIYVQFCVFSDIFWNFWHIKCLFPINRHRVINSLKHYVFWPTLYFSSLLGHRKIIVTLIFVDTEVVTVGSGVYRRMRDACVAITLIVLHKWIQQLVTTHARTMLCMLAIVYILVVVPMSLAFSEVSNTVSNFLAEHCFHSLAFLCLVV